MILHHKFVVIVLVHVILQHPLSESCMLSDRENYEVKLTLIFCKLYFLRKNNYCNGNSSFSLVRNCETS